MRRKVDHLRMHAGFVALPAGCWSREARGARPWPVPSLLKLPLSTRSVEPLSRAARAEDVMDEAPGGQVDGSD